MTASNLRQEWRKSSYSDNGGPSCLEVRDGIAGAVPVRDSKQPEGAQLRVPASAWAAFLGHLTRGGAVRSR
ncbi:DUF397 domain-containing protein [Streptomyces aidingensis]|uniref:DUF397 domain-containing protein n=1 Tax=Streptomyces aidingensis TaxID=910347 RepID=A0A1I1RKH3_9ACTN|nr:DUF397 domain-containing protein [Streptomyces aidingensis]SFD34826.1 protein of unknown function [Streptomyces aidingensis]